jgi:RecA/RadA recombinase
MSRSKKAQPTTTKAKLDTAGELFTRFPAADRDLLKGMASVASKIKGFKPASEVLTKVRSHPTVFPLYDRATRIGGHPLERFSLVHGPSNHGKTAFVHGLGLSFLRANDFYAYVDAEFTTPEDWMATLMAQYADHPGFLAMRPSSFDETVESVRSAVTGIAKARDEGVIPPETTALVVVDSIQKLIPKKLLTKVLKGKDGFDGAEGRGAQIKAALNSQWLNELTPLLYHAKASMVFISREYEAGVDLSKLHEPGGGSEYKVGGGKALVFEASQVMRVTRSFVKEVRGEEKVIVGERHEIAITKTKVAGKQDRIERGYFHTSNGVLVPQGFDRARDVLELAQDSGHVVLNGSWLVCDVLKQKWQGESKAVVALSKDPFLLDTLEGAARSPV